MARIEMGKIQWHMPKLQPQRKQLLSRQMQDHHVPIGSSFAYDSRTKCICGKDDENQKPKAISRAINILHLLRIPGENGHHLAEGKVEIHLLIITDTAKVVRETR